MVTVDESNVDIIMSEEINNHGNLFSNDSDRHSVESSKVCENGNIVVQEQCWVLEQEVADM